MEASDLQAQSGDDAKLELKSIDPALIDNLALRSAMERIRERCQPDPHASYHTKHSSHNRYSKGW